MGRFIRALINGGELDGIRILSKARLDEMTAPANATPAGYLGLVFFGTKVAGYDSIGQGGATMTFFSDLNFFPEQRVGIFVSRDGMGEITGLEDLTKMPDPATVIAERFLPKASEATVAGTTIRSGDAAGTYHSSRRTESSFTRLSDLVSQRIVKIDSAGIVKVVFCDLAVR
jgi:hypothetical protein